MHKTKHITIVSISYFEYDRRLQRIIEALLNQQYTITWLSRTKTHQSKQIDGVNHIIIKTLISKGILFYFEYQLRVFFNLLFYKTDVINAVDIDTLPSSVCLGLIKRKKVILDAHELFHKVPELNGKPFKKWVWKQLSKRLIPFTSARYTVNQSLSIAYEALTGKKFAIIRNLPFHYNRNSSTSITHKTLVYLGVVNVGRGVEIAIEALKFLPEYKLLIIGGGDLLSQMQKLASALGVNKRVTFMGYISPSEIMDIMQKGSIGLNLLDDNSDNYKYSLANKFFDYIQATLPSISMRYPEYESINNQYHISKLIDRYKVDDLLDAIAWLEDPNNYNALKLNCLSAKKTLNWSQEAMHLINIYRSL